MWALLAHNDRLADLEEEDPRFADCPSFCSRPEADMKRGCPDCPVQMMFAETEEEVAEEFANIAERRGFERSHRWPYSFRQLNADVDLISSLDAAQGGSGSNPKWTVRQKILVSHLRALRSLHNRIETKRRIREARERAGLQN